MNSQNLTCLMCFSPLKLLSLLILKMISSLVSGGIFKLLVHTFDMTNSLIASLISGIRRYELPWWHRGKDSDCQCRRYRFNPWVGKIPWRRKWQATPVFLPWKSHGQRSQAGNSPRGLKRVRHELVTKQQHNKIFQVNFVLFLPCFGINHFPENLYFFQWKMALRDHSLHTRDALCYWVSLCFQAFSVFQWTAKKINI